MKGWKWLLFVAVLLAWGSFVYVLLFNRAVDFYRQQWERDE